MKNLLVIGNRKISTEKLKTIAAVAAAVIMYFTPDPIDAIITALLSALGITNLVIDRKDK